MSVPLSVLIITGNEEINIRQALDNVCGWADEVFVVDSFSTDRTVEIAQEMGAQVVQNPWPGYSAQKNWALDHLPFRNEWVFILDADEYLSDELKQEMSEILDVGGRGFDGFYIKRRFIFYGKWIRHCGWYPCWVLRFFRHRLGRFEERPVDEHVIVRGKVGECKHDIIHRDLHDMSYWIAKHIRYAQLNTLAEEQLDSNQGAAERIRPNLFGSQAERRRFIKERVFRHLPARALWYFLYLYIFRLGFLDGQKGLVFCLMHAIFVEFRVVMQWERMHLHELDYCGPASREDAPEVPALAQKSSNKL